MIYKMGWIDYDSYMYFLLEHDANKTKEQFEEDCIKAIREVGENYLNEENGWISACEWIKIAAEKMKDYGYNEVETITWDHSGSDIIGDHDIDNDFNIVLRSISEDDEKWRTIVGDVLFKKSLEKNLIKYIELYSNSIQKMKKKYILEDLERLRF